ncbi:MAG: hypothetical protein KDB82_02745 [Planctomycetes bacterium]|nr:hypothetical protein [Planctomycetota bacterium]
MDQDPQKRLKEFHGKTCVVETKLDQTFIGRCSRFEKDNLIMVDLDHLHGGWDKNTEKLENAVNMGHWPVIKKVFIPKADITRMELLVKQPWKDNSVNFDHESVGDTPGAATADG